VSLRGAVPIELPGGARRLETTGECTLASLLTGRNIVIALVALALLYLVAAPLFMLLLSSVKSTKDSLPFEPTPFTLDNYVSVLTSERTYRLLGNTFLFAAGSLGISVVLGVLFAWLIERTDLPFAGTFATLLVVPMGIPPVLSAIAWVFILDPRIGLLNVMLRPVLGMQGQGPLNIYTIPGMFFVQGVVMVPTLYLMLSAAFRNMDPSLEEAAMASGATWWETARRVTLPVLTPALLAAMIYYAVVAIEAFEIPGAIGLSIGLTVFSTEIYNATHPAALGLPDYGRASALAMIVMVLAVALLTLYFRATHLAESFGTVTGRGFRPRRIPLGPWRYPALLLLGTYLFISVALVVVILLWISLQKFYSVPSLDALARVSLGAYEDVLSYPNIGQIFFNTIALGVLTAFVTVTVTFALSWVVIRAKVRGRGLFDASAFLPQAVPGVVIGLAVLVLHISFQVPIYGTILIITVGLTAKYLAFGARSLSAAYIQIHRELEEAAASSGAGLLATFRRVSLPLLMPATVNVWVWVFLHAIRELPVAAMLYAPGSVVLSTLIWSFWQDGKAALVGALGVFLFLISALVSGVARVYTTRQTLNSELH
jgi:iron(III) transport system permease protein